MLTSIVVYLYTVLAFNFFRKFYVQEEEGEEPDSKCHDMLSVCLSSLALSFKLSDLEHVPASLRLP